MSYGNVEATNRNRCPICGKPDYCCWYHPADKVNITIWVCKRDETKSNTYGNDAKKYMYIGDSRTGNSEYMELAEYEEWKGKFEKRQSSNYSRSKNQRTEFKKRESARTPELIEEPEIEVKKPEELDRIYRFIQSQLVLEGLHEKYLKRAKWEDWMIQKLHVVSFPEDDEIRKSYHSNVPYRNIRRAELADRILETFGADALLGVPGAFVKNGRWTFSGPSGILYPLYDMEGRLYRMKVRMDFRDRRYPMDTIFFDDGDTYTDEKGKILFISMKGLYRMNNGERVYVDIGMTGNGKKKSGKYRFLNSYFEDQNALDQGVRKNCYYKGCRSGNVISVYNDPSYDQTIWYEIEGEAKGAFVSMMRKAPVVTIPGVSSYMLAAKKELIEQERKKGMQCHVIAFDADKKTNAQVLRHEQQLVSALKEAGAEPIYLADWDMEQGKGLDDLIASGGTETYIPTL